MVHTRVQMAHELCLPLLTFEQLDSCDVLEVQDQALFAIEDQVRTPYNESAVLRLGVRECVV